MEIYIDYSGFKGEVEMPHTQRVKAVQILLETKQALDGLVMKYPDLKKLYFVDNAIRKEINMEYRIRELKEPENDSTRI